MKNNSKNRFTRKYVILKEENGELDGFINSWTDGKMDNYEWIHFYQATAKTLKTWSAKRYAKAQVESFKKRMPKSVFFIMDISANASTGLECMISGTTMFFPNMKAMMDYAKENCVPFYEITNVELLKEAL